MENLKRDAYLSKAIYIDLEDLEFVDQEMKRFKVEDVRNDSASGFYGAIIKDMQTGEGIST